MDADAEIDLIFTDGRFNMTAQRAPVNDVLEIALVHIYGAILFEESWLDVTQSIGFSRRAVVSAAAEAVEKDTVFQRIQHRLQSDRRYMKTLSNYVCVSFMRPVDITHNVRTDKGSYWPVSPDCQGHRRQHNSGLISSNTKRHKWLHRAPDDEPALHICG